MKSQPKGLKGFEKSLTDSDKGAREGSKADLANDKKEMPDFAKKGMRKKGLEIKIEAKPVNKGDMAKREKSIRDSAGPPRGDIMPMPVRRRY